ncbi:MAG TPA: CopG family transcriptional regulator [Longimicrobium sp.]
MSSSTPPIINAGRGLVVRTQLYLTPEEQGALQALSRRTGRSRSELIREAIDAMLAQPEPERCFQMQQARGLWSDREDLPDFVAFHSET